MRWSSRKLGTVTIYTARLPAGALSKTLRSYFPSSPQRYLHLFPQSHWTTTDPPSCPTSTTVPTWPSPPSWSPHDHDGPRTTRNPACNSILITELVPRFWYNYDAGSWNEWILNMHTGRHAGPCKRSKAHAGLANGLRHMYKLTQDW